MCLDVWDKFGTSATRAFVAVVTESVRRDCEDDAIWFQCGGHLREPAAFFCVCCRVRDRERPRCCFSSPARDHRLVTGKDDCIRCTDGCKCPMHTYHRQQQAATKKGKQSVVALTQQRVTVVFAIVAQREYAITLAAVTVQSRSRQHTTTRPSRAMFVARCQLRWTAYRNLLHAHTETH